MPHSRLQIFCNVDYFQEMALVAVQDAGGPEETIVGVGRYLMDEGMKSAEVAFAVRDEMQGLGIGRRLFAELAAVARRKDIHTFHADVLSENRAMLRVFRGGGFAMKTVRDAGVIRVEIDITQVGPAAGDGLSEDEPNPVRGGKSPEEK
jgi:acetyltransferase